MCERSLVEQYYICELCHNNFELESLYACQNGHFFCMNCFRKEYCRGKERRLNPKWKKYGKNGKKTRSQGDLDNEAKLMFPNPEEFSTTKDMKTSSQIQVMYKPSNMSLWSLSKKPLICPNRLCKKAIAISSIEDHFAHEHKNVALIKTEIDSRNGLDLHLEDINYNEKLCLVLINVIKPAQLLMLPKSHVINPTFVVIATKLALYDDYLQQEEEDDDVSEFSNPCSPSDKIIIWMASNIPTKYYYTLAISTVSNSVRLKYFGPLLTLKEDHEKLCEEGQGLILSQNHIIGMTDAGQKHLILDIIIHEEHIEIDQGN